MQREPVKERDRQTDRQTEEQDMEEVTQKEVVQNREGKVDDYILVKFMPLKSKDPKHYVGKIIEPETDDEDDELIVSFYRHS